MNSNLELKLQAWVDGELPEAEMLQIGRLAETDAEARALTAELRQTHAMLAGNDCARALPETREFYWSKIARQIEPEEHPAGRAMPWQRWLSAGAGFAALGCILTLALNPLASPAFEDFSSTSSGMEAVTFHDQSNGMTVVWLQDSSPFAESNTAQPATVSAAASDNNDVETQ